MSGWWLWFPLDLDVAAILVTLGVIAVRSRR